MQIQHAVIKNRISEIKVQQIEEVTIVRRCRNNTIRRCNSAFKTDYTIEQWIPEGVLNSAKFFSNAPTQVNQSFRLSGVRELVPNFSGSHCSGRIRLWNPWRTPIGDWITTSSILSHGLLEGWIRIKDQICLQSPSRVIAFVILQKILRKNRMTGSLLRAYVLTCFSTFTVDWFSLDCKTVLRTSHLDEVESIDKVRMCSYVNAKLHTSTWRLKIADTVIQA